jgi:integrase
MGALARGRKGEWKAYYWDRTEKKQVWVPREVTAEWDGLPEAEAQARLEEWLAAKGIERQRARRHTVLGGDEIVAQIEAYIREYATLREVSEGMLEDARRDLERAMEYFVGVHGAKNVRQWGRHAAGFTMWLVTTYTHMETSTHKKVCQNLRRFGEWLEAHQVLTTRWRILLPATKKKPPAPLPRMVGPDEMLAHARHLRAGGEPRWALALLLTYFGPLRPEETWALEKSDFLAGASARKDAKTHDGLRKHGLGSGLSVSVTKARTRRRSVDLPKTHYAYGVVNIWWGDAAAMIAEIVRGLPAGQLFPESRRECDAGYEKHVRPLVKLTQKDLQRAAAAHLGRVVGLDPYLEQDVMRHGSILTTLKYTRRPTEQKETDDTQDWDDVR